MRGQTLPSNPPPPPPPSPTPGSWSPPQTCTLILFGACTIDVTTSVHAHEHIQLGLDKSIGTMLVFAWDDACSCVLSTGMLLVSCTSCLGFVLWPGQVNSWACVVQGCFVKPGKLAELQMGAAGESYLPSSPMISGGSSDSTFA